MRSRSVTVPGLGSKSFERGENVELAPRRSLGFRCPVGHPFEIVFAEEAAMPLEWDCPRCGATSVRTDGSERAAIDTKPVRTHWDMLRERRSIAELEALLAERLAMLRSGTIGPNAYEVIAAKGRATKRS
jgi:hypothetical protein